MSTLRELRKDMKDRELQAKKLNPRPSPPTSEIGSVLFGSAKSEHFGLTVSETDNEQEEDKPIQNHYFFRIFLKICKIQKEKVIFF